MARYSILINVPQHKLRTLRASLCLTARLTLTPVQIWHVILNAWNVSREPSLCIYDGVLVKWHILEEEMLGMARWLEHHFRLYRGNAGSYTQNDPLSTTAFMSTTLSQSFRFVSPIFDEISSLKHLLLSFTGLKIHKIQYMTLIVPTSTLTIAVQHMLKHTKAFNSAFQTLIRCYVHKTRSFRNLILPPPPKQPILCTVECHFQC